MFLMVMFDEDKSLFSNDTLLEVLRICIIAVVLLIVAIPEGLPLAVSIAMALSIERMKSDETTAQKRSVEQPIDSSLKVTFISAAVRALVIGISYPHLS